jgi:hypothetical protein
VLARLHFHELVQQADYPGSGMVPAPSALLSLLTPKLLDKERRSHISDFNFDEALGLLAGLNILPKKSFATDYAYRTDRACQRRLLEGWTKGLSPLLFPAAGTFSVDFHPVPFRGDPTGLDRHYLPTRGRAGPSVLTFFLQDARVAGARDSRLGPGGAAGLRRVRRRCSWGFARPPSSSCSPPGLQ